MRDVSCSRKGSLVATVARRTLMALVAVSALTSAVAGQMPDQSGPGRCLPCFCDSHSLDVNVIEFDPCKTTRYDLDLTKWSQCTGRLPTTQRLPSNASKSTTGQITGFINGHFAQGCPSPPEFLVLSQLVARRNAMELEQHLGLRTTTTSGEWPIFQNIQLLPMPNHTNIDSTIHIDLLPTF